MTAPLFACDRPRFSGAELELGQLQAEGPLLCLVGAWAPLFQLLSGQQQLTGGSLSLCGHGAEGALAAGHVGLLAAGAALPADWKLSDLLGHSGALLGMSWREASERGRAGARELGLGDQLGTPFWRLTPAARRITGLLLALLGEPEVLALEEPFSGLEPSARKEVGQALERALRGRRALVSVAELPGSVEQDAFVQTCSELWFASERGLAGRGRYAELSAGAGHYRVVVLRHAEELCHELGELGYTVQPRRGGDGLGVLFTDAEARGTRPLLEAALAVDAPIVELSPLTLRPATPPPLAGTPVTAHRGV